MKVCLIGGSGRSGTTVLSEIFSCHPDMTDVPEWRFLVDPDGIIDFYNSSMNWSPYHHNLRLNRLKLLLYQTCDSNYFDKFLRYIDQHLLKIITSKFKISPRYAGVSAKDYSPNFRMYVDTLIDDLNDFEYFGEWIGLSYGYTRVQSYSSLNSQEHSKKIIRTFLLNVMSDVLLHQKKKYYLEKNTWNILWFDKILEILPEARLVHIYRDPRDVVVSFSKQTWMPSSVYQCAIIYRDILQRWDSIKSKVSHDTYLECSLEALVDDSEGVTKEICRFWDISWNKDLLSCDLSKSNQGRWKKELSLNEINSIEKILGEQIKKLGYLL